ncbi:MAG: hypothetical protein L3J26_10195 [Candidatus Polarisedimenticolaceae bacterium]|nr:hypothetical protein [Candidatus Polarisedimenticolaceae bacterium]
MSKKLIAAAVVALFAGTATAGGVFATLDTDMNGAVSKDEASAMSSLTEQWETLDADANGELSAEEFATYAAEEKPAAK